MTPAYLHYKPEYFRPEEFLDRETYARIVKAGVNPWVLLDSRILFTADGIRDYFGVPVYLNNWVFGGDKQWRGLRNPKAPQYSPTSQHSFGRAIDAHIKDMTAEEVRQAILARPNDSRFRFIMRLEGTVSWLHVDVANVPGRIVVFSP